MMVGFLTALFKNTFETSINKFSCCKSSDAKKRSALRVKDSPSLLAVGQHRNLGEL